MAASLCILYFYVASYFILFTPTLRRNALRLYNFTLSTCYSLLVTTHSSLQKCRSNGANVLQLILLLQRFRSYGAKMYIMYY